MAPFRFLHLADLHLETGNGGCASTRARLREAVFEAFRTAVDLALERSLDAVLIAGDAFDDPLVSIRTELFFTGQLRRLAEGGVHVLYACGNHDPGRGTGRAAKLGLDTSSGWRSRVTLFRGARPMVVTLEGRDGTPLAVVVGAGHHDDREERNLATGFHKQATDLPVVGLLHTQIEGALRAEEHQRYAPCTPADLAAVDYDYWALGHVHRRQRPVEDLPAWYPGNLQGRNPRETGAKGGLLVELVAGEPVAPEFVTLAPVRWERLEIDGLEGCHSHQELLEHLARPVTDLQEGLGQGTELALRLIPEGPCPVARALLDEESRSALEEELIDHCGALEVQLRPRGVTTPRDLEALRHTPSVLQAALELIERGREDGELLERLAPESLAGWSEKEAGDSPERRAYLTELMQGLEEELLTRGLKEG